MAIHSAVAAEYMLGYSSFQFRLTQGAYMYTCIPTLLYIGFPAQVNISFARTQIYDTPSHIYICPQLVLQRTR